MRVTLVHPTGYNFVPGKRDVTILVNRMAPIGILQLAAWLERSGHPTAVHDCLGPQAPKGVGKNVEHVLATNPELVGFSTTTSSFLDGYDMAVEIKRRCPEIKIVFGGVHVSAVGARLLPHFPAIDYLCQGEGEVLLEDLAAGRPLHEIGNLVYRDAGRVVTNPRRPRIRNLDDLPFPAYEKLAGFPQDYHLPLFNFSKRHGATMITSRGCTYSCSYCDRTVYEHRYTSNSPDYIWEHMRRLRDGFGVYHINFYDDLFTASRSRILGLCDLLCRKPLGMDFNCAVRVGQADLKLLAALKRAGCHQISIGIESAASEILTRHKPGLEVVSARETVRQAHRVGLRVKGLFIFGLPGETPQTVAMTSDFIESVGFDEINISKFSPFHGAPIWEECASGKAGRFNNDWRLLNCLHFTYVPQAFRSSDEMDYLYNQCVLRFYRGRQYQKLFRKRLWAHRWSLWQLLSKLPAFLQAYLQFRPSKSQLRKEAHALPLHPAQPEGLL